jgi:hypothetical protein
MVVHYLVNKNDILKLAQGQVKASNNNNNNNNNSTNGVSSRSNNSANNNNDNNNGVMKFVLLSPSTASGSTQQQIATSSDLVTNTGGIHAAVSWSPNPLMPKTQSTVKISFYDPVTSNPLSTNDIKYDMLILDKNGHAVITKQSLLAKNAVDTQTVTFPARDIYQIQLQINGLLKAGQTPDLTRNGLARGYVVVPEFPTYAFFLMIGSVFLGLLVVQRKSWLYKKLHSLTDRLY